jgi:hypothetical protein
MPPAGALFLRKRGEPSLDSLQIVDHGAARLADAIGHLTEAVRLKPVVNCHPIFASVRRICAGLAHRMLAPDRDRFRDRQPGLEGGRYADALPCLAALGDDVIH